MGRFGFTRRVLIPLKSGQPLGPRAWLHQGHHVRLNPFEIRATAWTNTEEKEFEISSVLIPLKSGQPLGHEDIVYLCIRDYVLIPLKSGQPLGQGRKMAGKKCLVLIPLKSGQPLGLQRQQISLTPRCLNPFEIRATAWTARLEKALPISVLQRGFTKIGVVSRADCFKLGSSRPSAWDCITL